LIKGVITLIRWIAFIAGIVGALAVGLGAFAAHGLEDYLLERGLAPELVAKKLNTCDIAVRYHLIHAVALLALAAAPATWAPRRRAAAAIFFVLGLGLFCGILYAQAIAGLSGMNGIVPLGGVSFIIGWLVTATVAFGRARHEPV
jgi:uncharacterized membrane protein YgdD (TMEM256/DUF423 family)